MKNDKDYNDSISSIRKDLKPFFKLSILAHLKTAIEQYAIARTGNPCSIIYRFVENELRSKKASIKYFKGGYIVYVKATLSLNEQRYLIGHELSHILISLMEDKIYNPKHRKYDNDREKLASLLSYQFHIDQSDQYKNNTADFIYKEEDYDSLKNRILETCSNKQTKFSNLK